MERERVRKRREKEHRGRQTVWWENTPHETHRPIYIIPTLGGEPARADGHVGLGSREYKQMIREASEVI